MQSIEQQIDEALVQAADAIRAQMQAAGVNASGRTSASVRVRHRGGSRQLVIGDSGTHTIDTGFGGSIQQRNTAPAETLEVGRAGGKVPAGFYYILREWSREKGLQFSNEQDRGTFAYFLARKIAREGTRRNRAHVQVYSEITKQTQARLRDIIGNYSRASIVSGIFGGSAKIKGVHTL